MTTRFFSTIALLTLALFMAGCGGTDTSITSPTAPSSGGSSSGGSSSSCNVSLSGLPSTVDADGGRYIFSIAAASGCSWSASTDAPWADVAPGSGQGNATPTLTILRNAAGDSRAVIVTVNTQSARIVQSRATVVCTYTLNRTSFDLAGDGGTLAVELTAPSGCAWTASASEGWIRVTTPSGSGSASVMFTVDPNTGDVRHAFATVAGQRVTITQEPR